LYTCDNKIFIDGENGKINVFDRDGKKSTVIGQDYEKVEVTKARKDRYEKFFLSDMRFKAVYERDRSRVKFPGTFPAVRHYHIADKKVYVLTYREKGNDKEFFIFDMNGKLLKHTFLPVQEMNALDIFPYTTKKGKLYQLVDNVETETWELHINEIK
jgi:hypothetical protein